MVRFVNPVDLRRNTTNRKIIFGLFVFTGILSLGFWLKGRDQSQDLLSPYKISYKVESKEVKIVQDTTRPTTELITQLQNLLDETQGEYGISVFRLQDGQGYGINEELVMPAASIMKVPMMIAAYQQIESEKLEETDEISQMLTAMGKRSDNAAPAVLIERIGRPKMRDAVLSLGMKKSDFDANTITALDLVEMWRRIYSEGVLSESHQTKMWADLQDSIFEERIPAGLPDDLDVVHKVGTDLNIWADTGIVLGQNPLVIVVLNKDVNLGEAKVLVPKLVRLIWDYEASRGAQQKP